MKKIIIVFVLIILLASILIYKNAMSESYTTSEIFISDTLLSMTIKTTSQNYQTLTNDIIKEIERSDSVLNPYNEQSEISRVNSLILSGQTNIEISSEFASLLDVGLRYSEYSGGIYDITLRNIVELWGFGLRVPSVPSYDDIPNALENVGYQYVSIQTNDDKYSVVVEKPVGFDFGSYGKGYILHNIKSILAKHQIKNYLINYGGNITLLGDNPKGSSWTVAIQNPRDYYDEYPILIQSTNSSIVTSGDYERFFIENNTRYHHIFDATTGFPIYNSVCVTIVSDNATESDLLSTVAFLMGTNFFTQEQFEYKEAYIMLEENNQLLIFENSKDNIQ